VIRLVSLIALVACTGCASVFRSHATAPNGLARDDDRLRHWLASGRADSALATLTADDDGDALLRLIHTAVAAFYAGDVATSAALLDRAVLLAEERETKSLSRAALSIVSNDLTLPWLPSDTERLLVPYYAARAYLEQHDLEGAVVEARRLSFLLERTAADASDDEIPLRATLRRLAGAIFEAAGRGNDARVAFRHAALLADAGMADPAPDTTTARSIPGGNGDVVVLIEHGFVAHRVEEAVYLYLFPEEVEALTDGEGDEKAAVAALLAARVVAHALDPRDALYSPHRGTLRVPRHDRPLVHRRKPCTGTATATADSATTPGRIAEQIAGNPPAESSETERSGKDCEEDDPGNPYLLKVAWPSYRASTRPATGVRVLVDSTEIHDATLGAVSSAVVHDFSEDRALLIAKTIARGAAKLSLTRTAEQKIGEKDETAGRIVGLLANAGALLLERADTRSLHLFPDAIGVIRLRLPAGEHDLTVEVDAPGGTRRIDIGPVVVRDGRLTFVAARAF
jgi:hypothetical protein